MNVSDKQMNRHFYSDLPEYHSWKSPGSSSLSSFLDVTPRTRGRWGNTEVRSRDYASDFSGVGSIRPVIVFLLPEATPAHTLHTALYTAYNTELSLTCRENYTTLFSWVLQGNMMMASHRYLELHWCSLDWTWTTSSCIHPPTQLFATTACTLCAVTQCPHS